MIYVFLVRQMTARFEPKAVIPAVANIAQLVWKDDQVVLKKKFTFHLKHPLNPPQ